ATARLDAAYLVWGLSANALPALTAGVDRLPPGPGAELRLRLLDRYGPKTTVGSCRWYESNLRHIEAARAPRGAGLLDEEIARSAQDWGGVRLDARPV